MTDLRQRGVARRGERRWSFASCVFDEANWTLTVGDRRAAVETKPLELLRELLLHAGNVVSKEQLLEAIWPDVTVVEASLPTAIRKLRRALGDDRNDRSLIETVPGIGYRFSVPVEVEESGAPLPQITIVGPAAGGPDRATGAAAPNARRAWKPVSMMVLAGAGLVLALLVFPGTSRPSQPVAAPRLTAPFSQREAASALRRMDIKKIETMLAAGWDPTSPFDKDRNGALNILLNNCEWDPEHDQRRMLLMARTLLDGGERLDYRNAWGDTPYSIAKADRYCGPNHPVTQMILTLCYSGYKPAGDRCLAAYQTKSSVRRRRDRGQPSDLPEG